MPDSTLPAVTLVSPLASGQDLAPLAEAPADTISGLKLDELPDGATYEIVMRPYGIGPDSLFGSRIAIRIDSATPLMGAPKYDTIVNANLLVVVDTDNGGTVEKGGTYTARLTFRSDGTKLLPILTKVTTS
jgi:hypothetical protein